MVVVAALWLLQVLLARTAQATHLPVLRPRRLLLSSARRPPQLLLQGVQTWCRPRWQMLSWLCQRAATSPHGRSTLLWVDASARSLKGGEIPVEEGGFAEEDLLVKASRAWNRKARVPPPQV